MSIKSERLKKLENELQDLSQWLKLDLVPKKDIEKHKAEILNVQNRIEEEKQRLRILKENGEVEEYITPRRNMGKNAYAETPTIGDVDMSEDTGSMNDVSVEIEHETATMTHTIVDDDDHEGREGKEDRTQTDDDDPFSDRNRWRRGIRDPESDEW